MGVGLQTGVGVASAMLAGWLAVGCGSPNEAGRGQVPVRTNPDSPLSPVADPRLVELERLEALLREVPDHEATLKASIVLRLELGIDTWKALRDARRYAALAPRDVRRLELVADACAAEHMPEAELEALGPPIRRASSQGKAEPEWYRALHLRRARVRMSLGNPGGACADYGTLKRNGYTAGLDAEILAAEVATGSVRDGLGLANYIEQYSNRDRAKEAPSEAWLAALELLTPFTQDGSAPVAIAAEVERKMLAAIDGGCFSMSPPEWVKQRPFVLTPERAKQLRAAYLESRRFFFKHLKFGIGLHREWLPSIDTIVARAERSTHWIPLGENQWLYINAGGPDLSQIALLLSWVGIADGAAGPKGVLLRDTLPADNSSVLYWLGGRTGDVIASINGEPINNLFEAGAVVATQIASQPDQAIREFTATAHRGGQPFDVRIVTFDPEMPVFGPGHDATPDPNKQAQKSPAE